MFCRESSAGMAPLLARHYINATAATNLSNTLNVIEGNTCQNKSPLRVAFTLTQYILFVLHFSFILYRIHLLKF